MKYISLILLLALSSCMAPTPTSENETEINGDHLFVGTYTRTEGHVAGKGKGIHILQWNKEDQTLQPFMVIEGPINPSYIALHPELPIVYTVNEIADNTPTHIGVIQAYQFDLQKKSSSLINEKPSLGDAPCHLSLSSDSKNLMVANYVGGSVTSYAINDDGSISDPISSFTNQKTTPATPRQEAGHAHMIRPIPNTKNILVADLGTDELITFEMNDTGAMQKLGSVVSGPNVGPRHFDFHPMLDMVYVLNELQPSISVFKIVDGMPTEKVQHLDIPIKKEGDAVYSSAIKAHPSGNIIYAATRGLDGSNQNEIVGCMVLEDGQLHIIQTIQTQGQVPRDFIISPDGKNLIVGNQDSHEVVTFEIDQNSFELKLLRKDQKVPTPVCFKWLVKT